MRPARPAPAGFKTVGVARRVTPSQLRKALTRGVTDQAKPGLLTEKLLFRVRKNQNVRRGTSRDQTRRGRRRSLAERVVPGHRTPGLGVLHVFGDDQIELDVRALDRARQLRSETPALATRARRDVVVDRAAVGHDHRALAVTEQRL